MHNSVTVCFFGFSEQKEGGRAWMVRTGLAENGVRIVSCRTGAEGLFVKYKELLQIWKGIPERIDAVYMIFMGYYLMPLAWVLARLRGVPVILDAMVSQYDTEVNDRKRLSRIHPKAWFLWAVDFFACFLADVVVVDTRVHGEYFTSKLFVNKKKIIIVPIGCRSDIFKPQSDVLESAEEFIIEFHGRFIPLQGIEHILAAAKILEEKKKRVRFEIIGDGQTFTQMENLAKELSVDNVFFLGSKMQEEIAEHIARSHICLGIFGTTEKALRVVPHKVYECLSCEKPVITERSPAALEMLHDGEDVCMVEPGNGADLAEKILMLKNDATLRAHLGKRARAISLGAFSTRMIVKDLVDWLELHT